MFSINITDDGGIAKISAKVDDIIKGDLPNTRKAVKMSADFVQSSWREVVDTAQVLQADGKQFTVRRRTGTYSNGIVVEYPASVDGLSAVVRATAPYSDSIEKGVSPYDMKPKLLKGKAFVRIPFRHGTPNGQSENKSATGLQKMPENIKTMLSNVKKLGTVSQGQRSKIIHDLEGNRKTYTWKTGPYSGMKRVGAARQGQYITWRTVSRRSDPSSWWHPGTPPRPISRAVAQSTFETVKEILTQGLIKDMDSIQE